MRSTGFAEVATFSRVNADCGCCPGILEQEAGSVKVSKLMLFEQLVPCFEALPLRRLALKKKEQECFPALHLSQIWAYGLKYLYCLGLVHPCKTELTSAFTPTETTVSK